MSGYDVIGDIHGHADALERLLAELGYREVGGTYEHPERQVVFLGDLVDSGPGQVRVLEVARAMVQADNALAVMGNHEFNAVAFATRIGEGRGDDDWARPRNVKNRQQHQRFLEEVVEDSSQHREWTDWFGTIPMWRDLGGLRVIHACWDERSMEVLGGPQLTREAVTAPKGSAAYEAIEILLKGPEVDLGGRCYKDKGGHHRTNARFKWWDPDATTLAEGALIPGGTTDCDGSPFAPLPDTPLDRSVLPQPISGTPVLYGHYWRNPAKGLSVDGPLSACLDWSVAKGGHLAAYRWSGEAELSNENLVSVPA